MTPQTIDLPSGTNALRGVPVREVSRRRCVACRGERLSSLPSPPLTIDLCVMHTELLRALHGAAGRRTS